MDLRKKDPYNTEESEAVGKAVLQLIERNLQVEQWRFRRTFTNFAKTSSILAIYDSEWCRVSFLVSRGRDPEDDEVSIEYGRLHAPNEEPFMVWQGEECNCWHHILDALRFLDGLSPLQAMEQARIRNELPRVIAEFRDSPDGQKLLQEYPPEYAVKQEAAIWEHYGIRLFELFDLRRPDLWDEFRAFLREYHRLLGTKTLYGPPEENVC
jgi:hypothetical protein